MVLPIPAEGTFRASKYIDIKHFPNSDERKRGEQPSDMRIMKARKPSSILRSFALLCASLLCLGTPLALHANYIYNFVDQGGQGATGQLILAAVPTTDQTPLAGSYYTLNGITWNFATLANSWSGNLEAISGFYADTTALNLAFFDQTSSPFTQSVILLPAGGGDSGIWRAVPDTSSTIFILFISLTALCAAERVAAGRKPPFAVCPVPSKEL